MLAAVPPKPATAPAPMFGLAPPDVYGEVCRAAAKKAAQPWHVTAALGFSAGALIGIGAVLMTAVGASSPSMAEADVGLVNFLKGAVGLPCGLTLVVLTGAELFTSNIMTMLIGVLQGTARTTGLLRNWVISYVGNFLGSIFMAWLSNAAHTLSAEPQVKAGVGIAIAKAGLPFGVAVAKGMLCNWLVCLAVWGAMASPSIAGKVLAIFWPISTFVALGFEHCVANMFLLPQGMLLGAEVSVSQFLFGNIFPVTLGNLIGAGVFVAGIQFIAFGDYCKARKSNDEDDDDASDDDDEP